MTAKLTTAFCSVLLACIWSSGCAKKVPVAKAPATPPPAAAAAAPSAPVAARQAPARQNAPTQVATSRVPSAETRARIQDLLNRIEDAYFDYNKNNLRPDAEAALRADARTLSEILRDYPDYKLTVEGYCDERGSDEYNMALGDARAKRAKSFLTDSGIPDTQVRVVSFGKERQVCGEHDEACWQKNRRAHITQAQ